MIDQALTIPHIDLLLVALVMAATCLTLERVARARLIDAGADARWPILATATTVLTVSLAAWGGARVLAHDLQALAGLARVSATQLELQGAGALTPGGTEDRARATQVLRALSRDAGLVTDAALVGRDSSGGAAIITDAPAGDAAILLSGAPIGWSPALQEAFDGHLTLPQTARLVDGRAVMQAYAPVRHGGSTSAVLRVASPAAPWLLGVWAVRALITFAGVTLVVVELLVYTRPRGRASAAYEVALATASDELRVPLHGMLGQIEALREADLRRDHAEIVRSLYAQARLTTRLASDLLDLGKLAAGELLLEVEPFRAHDIVQEVVQQEQAYALTRGVPLRFEASGATEALVASDPVRFRQVVARLLHHTLQTSERGPVTVTLTQHPAQNDEHVVEVAIHDPSHLPQPSRDTSLTIARALGERLGGVIAVDSPNAPTFRLPAPVAHVSQAWAAPQHTPNAPTPPLFRGPKPRVLVAEDNPVNQRILRMQLELMGLDVHVVGDGREAVRACRQQRFALVLMDLSMPEVSGVEAARLIRGMTHGHQPPIYALTGSVADDDRSDCERAGMTGFLEKPLGFDRLRATISAALPDHAMPATRAAV